MSHDNFGSNNRASHGATGESVQTGSSSLTQTVTVSIKEKFSKLKTLVLKLKPSSRGPDLSSMNSEQLDTFVDDMVNDLQGTFTRNINELRDRIKSARPDPADPDYAVKMQLYEELLSMMLPIIQEIRVLAGQVLDELHELINHLWDDICKNNGTNVDRLLEEHARLTETKVTKTFLEPLALLETKLDQIKQSHQQ